MRIGIDTQTTLGQKTGFGFYVSNLVAELRAIGSYHYESFAPQTERDFSAPQRFWWDQLLLPARARRAKVDILHQPAFSAPVFYQGKVVVTVHDLIAIFFGEEIPFFSRQYFGRWMPFSYRFADHIIAISENTKRDIVRTLGIRQDKISVIYEAAGATYHPVQDPARIKRIKARYQTGDRYLLHIGTLNPRKNLSFLIEVFANLIGRSRDLNLVIAGKPGWYYEGLFQQVESLGLTKRVKFLGYVPEQDKPALLTGASAFVFPSRYEGFGLPVLEAMACGCPVVAARVSSIPEVVGEAGILLPLNDTSAWVRALSRMSQPQFRNKLRLAGLKQARKFTWRKAAEQTIAVYEKVYETNPANHL